MHKMRTAIEQWLAARDRFHEYGMSYTALS